MADTIMRRKAARNGGHMPEDPETVDAIRGVMGSAALVESHKAAILAALAITDELFRERAGNAEMADAMDGLSSELRRWLPPGKRGESAAG